MTIADYLLAIRANGKAGILEGNGPFSRYALLRRGNPEVTTTVWTEFIST